MNWRLWLRGAGRAMLPSDAPREKDSGEFYRQLWQEAEEDVLAMAQIVVEVTDDVRLGQEVAKRVAKRAAVKGSE